MTGTTIYIRDDVKKALLDRKTHPRDTYNDVINSLLSNPEKKEATP